jgi:50S ribosomal subunit-associated GTPase HflX
MSGPALRDRVEDTLQHALTRTASRPALSDLHATLVQAQRRLHQPMRVAIVGLIKAGKSTLMNGLLGEEVAATGTVEATFNVTELRYAEQPARTWEWSSSPRVMRWAGTIGSS